MKKPPHWISEKALLQLHEESLAVFGGARGLRDSALLESALARPLNAHGYRPKSTIADLAASDAFGLARNHPFVDGSKRAAFLSIGLFLAINGARLVADQVNAIQTMMALADGSLDEKSLAEWIKANSDPL